MVPVKLRVWWFLVQLGGFFGCWYNWEGSVVWYNQEDLVAARVPRRVFAVYSGCWYNQLVGNSVAAEKLGGLGSCWYNREALMAAGTTHWWDV